MHYRGLIATCARLGRSGLALLAILSFAVAADSPAQAREFRALPEGMKFSFTSKAGEKIKLETLSGKKFECGKVTGSGEFKKPTGENRSGPFELKFTECKSGSNTCTGALDESGHITTKGEFDIRHVLKGETSEPEKAATLDLLFNMSFFNCGLAQYILAGCWATMPLLTKAGGFSVINLLLESMVAEFLQKTGDPGTTQIDGDSSLMMELCQTLLKEGEQPWEGPGVLYVLLMEKFKNAAGETVTGLIDLSGTY